MPWTGKSFAARHNHKLKGKRAAKAAAIADAMLVRGVDEGEAIRTANARAAGYHGKGKQASKSAKARTGKTRSWTGS